MSLLNAWITPAAALVAVDTDGAGFDGARMSASKLLPIPHLNAVVAIRGQLAFLSFVFLRCISSPFESFDDLVDALPVVLREADRLIAAEYVVAGCAQGNELIAVGWSDRKGAMCGMQFVKRDAMERFTVEEADFHVSPYGTALSDLHIGPSNVEAIARAQVGWMRESFGAPCGGRLLLCNLDRHAMSVRHGINL